ncbi:PucR family transcriptional regulator ligand-binding domain-containing protein [Bacillus sp. H-16]|uniref:PucR family transcriptional regulator n=1 Tax=Alteribacter salitolerans TaxID=2912333 RepID=UPI0019626EFF|nr:PucR family transcriptional regulator [Alteribacter salitolerans]MBM7094563.1 PucR family transcriptional regulator ligand-binding domain-containing protein [Alteribacter salitolerans]
MLTIKEALKLPALHETIIRAGESGTDHTIKWVTTVEIIEDISRFQEGEFLVTTGFGLNEDTPYKERLISLIKEKKLAGMALYTGFYIPHIPDELIDAADDAGLPLIEIPPSINFSTVTKAILEQMANRQIRILEDSLSIHKEMTKLALSNDGLDQILKKLSELTHSSMFVFDDMFQLHAYVKRHGQMQVEKNGIYMNNDSFSLKDYVDVLSREEKRFHHYVWHSFPCFLTPVKTGEFIYGYLLMINEKTYSSEMDEVILEHVATLIGIEFVKEYAIEETEVRLQGELVEEVLQKKDIDENTALRRGFKLGFDLSKKQAVLYAKVKMQSLFTKKHQDFGKQLHYIASQQLSKSTSQSILLPKTDALVALIETNGPSKTEDKQQLRTYAEGILKHWRFHYSEPLTIGIGRPYQSIGDLSTSGREAEYAVSYSSLLLSKTDIIHYDDLGFYHLLIQMQESGVPLEQFYSDYLGDLVKGDRHRTDLILTLETYLGHNCHIQQTAAKLYIHRHTLKYRLTQIEKKTGLNIDSAGDRLNLHLAVMAYKFSQADSSA